MKNAIFAIILLLSASTAIAQSYGYMLPSYPERFGKGIRKIVEIQDDGTMRYKLKYYPGSPKHPANNEEFYYHTVKNKFITCNGGYIADYGMLPRKARRFVASSGYDRSEVSKVVCTSNEYHIRPWPKEDRKVSRSHWWVVLADSTCICFDRRGRFQMVEHYYDGLDARWISMIPDKALSHIKQECGANEKYHILRISVSARGWRVYYWIETPGLIKSGLPPSYLYDRNWNVISGYYPI